MSRRNMEVGDIVVVDDERINALGVVTEISGEPGKTDGVGNESKGKWAYRIRFLCGINRVDGALLPYGDEAWLNDDPWRIHVDGEDGFSLPESFLGRNVTDLLAQSGVQRKALSPEQMAAVNRKRQRKRIATIVIAVVCVVAIVVGVTTLVKHRRQQEAMQQQREQMQDLIDSTDPYALKLLRNCGNLSTISTGYGVEYATITPRTDEMDWTTLGCMVKSMDEEANAANELALWQNIVTAMSGNIITDENQLESLSWQSFMGIEARCAVDFNSVMHCNVRSGEGGDSPSADNPTPVESPSSESSSSSQGAGDSQQAAGEFDPDNVRGRWCRKDGTTCVVITPQAEGKSTPLVLDTSQMGDENPLPGGQTSTLMGYNYQSQPSASDAEQQLHMITQYSYRIDCSMYGDPCDGDTLHVADMAIGGAPGTGIKFEQKPLLVTRVGPTNAMPIDGLDESNPPEQVAYLIIQPYGETPANSVSNDTVFYSRMT
ncbi:hypothetical protein [Bifidobacterium pseudolongum]|uniref:Uncharacterized protein n=1 Tax=Bifidobacterium pseudolongum TaxID=1694 RepID=A0A395XE67_9BIFI|nr:hypothetical protein [Bifidobacterium pseudolongum]RGW09960.1 hypothetical protein DWV92_05010 [Bifidobacterium pseudolongum]